MQYERWDFVRGENVEGRRRSLNGGVEMDGRMKELSSGKQVAMCPSPSRRRADVSATFQVAQPELRDPPPRSYAS